MAEDEGKAKQNTPCPHIESSLRLELEKAMSIPLVDIKANYLSVQGDIDAALAGVVNHT